MGFLGFFLGFLVSRLGEIDGYQKAYILACSISEMFFLDQPFFAFPTLVGHKPQSKAFSATSPPLRPFKPPKSLNIRKTTQKLKLTSSVHSPLKTRSETQRKSHTINQQKNASPFSQPKNVFPLPKTWPGPLLTPGRLPELAAPGSRVLLSEVGASGAEPQRLRTAAGSSGAAETHWWLWKWEGAIRPKWYGLFLFIFFFGGVSWIGLGRKVWLWDP